jgi:mRNA-degrading endonuclease toxin of MazEF toxin-antitoxin module
VLVPRPAVVLTPVPLGPEGLLTWTLMITNASRAEWPGDVDVEKAEEIGLLIPSKVRTAKIAAVETASATLIARLDERTLRRVLDQVRANLAL